MEITKEFLDSNEQKDGYIIVAHDPKEDRPPNDAYIIDGYDIVKGESINDYNAGFKQIAPGSIHGTVFNDENKDGLLNDSGINGVEVTLQRYAMKDGESWQFMGEEYTLHCLSDQDGNYQFDDLPAASIVNGETVIYGYRLSIETLPQGYTVTSYHKNSGNKDSDLDETTGTMMNTEEIFALAKKADATVDDLYVVNGYDYLSSSNISDINAGLCTYENGMIEGILFKDKNKDGISE